MSESSYTEDDTEAIYMGDHPDFEPEPTLRIDDGERRWHHDWTYIMRHRDGSYWAVSVSLGATEMQDHEFGDAPKLVEVRSEVIPAQKVLAFYIGEERLGVVAVSATSEPPAIV